VTDGRNPLTRHVQICSLHLVSQTTTERVAASVRAEAARRRLTTRELADVVGVSTATMQRRLRAELEFPVSELARLAEHLGVPIERLVGTEERAS
jgi:transcriptional regulator with XRE-family HTH domain